MKKRQLSAALGLSLLLILFAGTEGRAAGPAVILGDIRAEDVRTSRTIAPGIELVEIKRGDFAAAPGTPAISAPTR